MDTKNVFTKTFGKKPAAPAITPLKEVAQMPAEKPAKTKLAKTAATEKPSVPKAASVARPSARQKAAPEPVIIAPPMPVARQMAEHFNSENIVRAIHKEKEELQRITVDVPKDIYLKMKVHLAHENVSIRDFVVRLIDVYLIKNNIR